MFIKLNEEEKELLNENKKEYTQVKKLKYNTPKEEFIVESYNKGKSVSDIAKEANVSMGLLYTVLNNYKVSKRYNKSAVKKRVNRIMNDPETVKNIIRDYQFMSIEDIYKKYNIHKNGLYYILDFYRVERKAELKDKVLSEGDIVVE